MAAGAPQPVSNLVRKEVEAGAALRSTVDPDLAAAAMSQVTLRERARSKHGEDARSMYFTPDALEQSTRREVAAHRAARVSFTHPSSVVDLGCGVGGDLLALARRQSGTATPVAGVESDPVRAVLAEANLKALDLPGAVSNADATRLEELPGVGPVTAAKIVAWRDEHGRFSRVEELQEVDGIGPKTYAEIAPHVRV